MLKPRRRSPRSWIAAVVGVMLVALVPTSAWAQAAGKGKKEPTPEELKGYTLPYFFTAVGVLAVTMTICWPANRKWEVSLTDDDE
jgi:hypothetical protein